MRISLDEVRNVDFQDKRYYILLLNKTRNERPILAIGRYNDYQLNFEYFDYSKERFQTIDIFDKKLIHVFSLNNCITAIENGVLL